MQDFAQAAADRPDHFDNATDAQHRPETVAVTQVGIRGGTLLFSDEPGPAPERNCHQQGFE